MKLRHRENYCQGSWVWIKSSWALGRDLDPIQNPPADRGRLWRLLAILITHSKGHIQGEAWLKAQALPSCQNKHSPSGPGPLQTLMCLESILFALTVRKGCRLSLHRVDPVRQLEDYKTILQHFPHHTQRDGDTEKAVSSRSYHRNVTQKKISPFSSHKTGKITLGKLEDRTLNWNF